MNNETEVSDILVSLENEMKGKVEKFKKELTTLRTGRANPQLLDGVFVEYYGAKVPLKQIASISIPEARTLEVRPFDMSALENIEAELKKMDLGSSPSSDGKIIRINLPAMTEEQRKKMVKMVREMGEESKIAIRNERRDALNILKKAEKRSEITEDDLESYEQKVQALTDTHIKGVVGVIDFKEKELLTI
ncbi:MAG: ribosome recycling factor [Elusimicrobiales bacterium]|nr:ribosome recycling factor [Elusimicrobiales bacterium]MCK5106547.1 ribosome recycling factor [Elusimicrobiales bacterium]MCK5357950.1 ribosome recycling factor [Elusimicrobiales bacterium]